MKLPDEITVQDVKTLRDGDEDFVLLDCRNPDECEIAKLDGSMLIPMGEITERAGELEPYQHRRIVVYCHHGGRSEMVCGWLRSRGFESVQNMLGGIDAWSCQIDNGMPRY